MFSEITCLQILAWDGIHGRIGGWFRLLVRLTQLRALLYSVGFFFLALRCPTVAPRRAEPRASAHGIVIVIVVLYPYDCIYIEFEQVQAHERRLNTIKLYGRLRPERRGTRPLGSCLAFVCRGFCPRVPSLCLLARKVSFFLLSVGQSAASSKWQVIIAPTYLKHSLLVRRLSTRIILRTRRQAVLCQFILKNPAPFLSAPRLVCASELASNRRHRCCVG